MYLWYVSLFFADRLQGSAPCRRFLSRRTPRPCSPLQSALRHQPLRVTGGDDTLQERPPRGRRIHIV
jgi:hypothetical protein